MSDPLTNGVLDLAAPQRLVTMADWKPSTRLEGIAPSNTREWHREYQRRSRLTHKGRERVVRSNLRALHSLTIEQYADLYEAQHGRCAICGNAIARAFDQHKEAGKRGPHSRGAHIDHDHSCCPGQKSCGSCIRGLLCNACNTGIGYLRDNVGLMYKAIDYLVSWRARQARTSEAA